jgi:hypothetical protein
MGGVVVRGVGFVHARIEFFRIRVRLGVVEQPLSRSGLVRRQSCGVGAERHVPVAADSGFGGKTDHRPFSGSSLAGESKESGPISPQTIVL